MGRVAHLRLGAAPRPRDHEVAAGAIERVGIGHLVDRPFQEISGGERQLVLMLRGGGVYRDGPTREVITQETLTELYGTATAVVGTGIDSPQGEIHVCVPLLSTPTEKESS